MNNERRWLFPFKKIIFISNFQMPRISNNVFGWKTLENYICKKKEKKPAAYLPECTHNAQSFDCIFIFYDFINQRISILIYEMNSLFYVQHVRSEKKNLFFLGIRVFFFTSSISVTHFLKLIYCFYYRVFILVYAWLTRF